LPQNSDSKPESSWARQEQKVEKQKEGGILEGGKKRKHEAFNRGYLRNYSNSSNFRKKPPNPSSLDSLSNVVDFYDHPSPRSSQNGLQKIKKKCEIHETIQFA